MCIRDSDITGHHADMRRFMEYSATESQNGILSHAFIGLSGINKIEFVVVNIDPSRPVQQLSLIHI
ncbi:hypothetical protein [Erwinia amylovora]